MYQRQNKRQSSPFQYIDKPGYHKAERDALTEDEVMKLFMPGVLQDTMELAVCGVIFLSGLRRAGVSVLKPEDLDWNTPKILVRRSYQRFNGKNKVLSTTKGKKPGDAPFDPILQEAVKKLWAENGKHEFVFTGEKGKVIGSSWIKGHFPDWLKRAGIEPGGRKIVPHSACHSPASLLEARGVSLRYIQELLGHSDLKTTGGCLHSTSETIRAVGRRDEDKSGKFQNKHQGKTGPGCNRQGFAAADSRGPRVSINAKESPKEPAARVISHIPANASVFSWVSISLSVRSSLAS
jgi:integrase